MADKPTATLFVELRGDIGRLETDMKKAVNVMNRTDSSISRITKKIESSFGGIQGAIGKASIAIVGINQSLELIGKGAAVAKAAIDAMAKGDAILAVEKSFQDLQQAAGRDATDALEKLRSATLGTIDTFELMKQANSSVTLGLPIEKLDELALAATRLGRAVGRDASDAFSALVEGLGRGSTEMLDNLGIVVKAGEAQQWYAGTIGKTVSQLSDSEKRLAFQEAAFKKIAEESARFSEVTVTAGLSAKVFATNVENLTQEFIKGLAESESLGRSFEDLNKLLSDVEFQQAARDAGELAANLISLGTDAIIPILQLIQSLIESLSNLSVEFGNVGKTAAVAFGQTDFASLREKAIAEAAAVGKDIRNTEEIIQAVMKGQNTFEDFQKSIGVFKEAAPVIAKVGEEAEETAAGVEKLTAEQKKAANEAKRLAKEKQNLTKEWEKLNQAIRDESLNDSLQEAIENLDGATFDNLRFQLESNVFNATAAGLEKMLSAGVIDTTQAEEYSMKIASSARKEWEEKMSEAVGKHQEEMAEAAIENAKAAEEAQFRAYERATEYFRGRFRDVFAATGEIDGALLGIATGFAASLSAATKSGIEEGAMSLENIGEAIAEQLGLNDLFSEIFGAASSQNFDYTQNNPEGFYGPGGDPSGSGQGQAPTSGGGGAAGYIQGGLTVIGSATTMSEKNKASNSNEGTGELVGAAIGMGIGAAVGGPLGAAIGAQLGQMGGGFIGSFLGTGSGDKGEQARKQFEQYVEETFHKLGSVAFFGADGLKVFKGDRLNFVKGSADAFNEEWATAFNEVDQAAGNVFSGLGFGLQKVLGITEDVAGQMGVMLAENLGGNLDNARLLVLQLGLSLEEMEAAMVQAGLSGEQSWHEVEVGLQGVHRAFEAGLEAVGDISGAFEMLEGSGGRGVAALKAIKDIAHEAMEAGATTMQDLRQKALEAGVDEENIDAYLQALEQRGITTLEQVATASDRILGGVVADIQSASETMAKEWKDIGLQLDDIDQKLRNLPEEINSNVHITVTSQMDRDAKALIDQVNSGESSANIDLPTTGMAKGGIISSRTRMGNVVAGENGREAILPLRQMANGNLGVASEGGGGRGGKSTVINIDARGAASGVEQLIRAEIEAMGEYAIAKSVEIVGSEMARAGY